MNNIYGIIWGQCNSGLQSSLKVNEDFPSKSKMSDLLWLMKETKNITAGIDVKLNKSASLYLYIIRFIKLQQGENEPNYTFKLHFDNVYDIMELDGGDLSEGAINSPIWMENKRHLSNTYSY